ncbi:RHS repeat domain-containing protein, partial [Alienimonas sp. DA493]|uniref:RHS repeat domain-containing protein n=1 Tax=Alienimonas sp. DA493 TaxID=3373605 RepID=UPI003754D3DA
GADQLFAVEDGSGDVAWALGDHQGSVRDWAELASGGVSVVDHLAFDSYGGVLSQSDPTRGPPAYAYTGREWDADAQLYYYRARWYDPVAGRFVSEDPLGFAAGDANLMRYVGNAVKFLVDPTGLRGGLCGLMMAARQHPDWRPYMAPRSAESCALYGVPYIPPPSELPSIGPAPTPYCPPEPVPDQMFRGFFLTAGDYVPTSGEDLWAMSVAGQCEQLGTIIGDPVGYHAECTKTFNDACEYIQTPEGVGRAAGHGFAFLCFKRVAAPGNAAAAATTRCVSGNSATAAAGTAPRGLLCRQGLSYELKHLNKHLPDTSESARLIRKDGSAHVFKDKATLGRVEQELLRCGDSLGTVRGWERYGKYFNEPIGFRIDAQGNKIPLHYGELKLKAETGCYHVIPRTRPAS